MSAAPNTDAASGRMLAPCDVYSASAIAEPSPAPACTTTSWPCSTSSRTPAGVSATRYSSVLISVGQPTFMGSFLSPPGGSQPHGPHQLPPAQGEPEVDPVA